MRRTARGGMKKLRTTEAVIEALGGLGSVRKLTEATSAQQVNNWLGRRFPARLYLVMQTELTAKGFTAPASLWGVKEPRVAASKETQAAV